MRGSILQTMALVAAAGVVAVASAALTKGSPAQPDVSVSLRERSISAVKPERALLLAITRVDQRLVSVGEHGTIGLSDDHGATWRSAEVPVDVTLTAVKFANAKTGWAVGHMGVVLRTDDGGESWHKQFDGSAIAALVSDNSRNHPHSADDQQLQRLALEGPDKPLLDLLVEDDQRVTVVGAFNLAASTRDGGKTWTLLSSRIENSNQMHLYGIASAGDGVFAVGEQALLLKRVGERYVALKSPYEGSYFGIVPAGDRLLVVFGLRGNVFQSFDGGGNWRRSNLPGASASINGALRLAHGRLILFDQAGGVFASVDGGANFQRVPFDWGAPLTGLVEAADGSLIATSVIGITRIPKTALAQPFLEAGLLGGQR